MSRGRRSATSVLGRAVAAWSARAYDGKLDALLDLSGNGLHARLGSAVGADTNDPLRLQYSGQKAVYFPGSSGNYISLPDNAAVSITSDIDLRRQIAPSSWTGSTQVLIDKYVTGSKSYAFVLMTSGVLRLVWSTDGSADTIAESTAATGFAANSEKWVRVTLDVDNGSGGYTVTFYTSSDGETWTQLGTPVVGGAPTSIFDGTSIVELGAGATGTASLFTGRGNRAQIYDGIGGTLVASFDASKLTEPYASYTDPQGNVWTLNRSATGRKLAVVDRDLLLLGTDDYLEVADSPLLNFGAGQAATIVMLYRAYGATFAANTTLFAKRNNLGTSPTDTGYMGRLVSGQTNAYFILDDGTNVPFAAASVYTSGLINMANCVRRATAKIVVASTGAFGSEANDTTGNLTNTNTFRIGRLSGAGTSYSDMEFIGGCIFRSAITADELIRLKGELLAL